MKTKKSRGKRIRILLLVAAAIASLFTLAFVAIDQGRPNAIELVSASNESTVSWEQYHDAIEQSGRSQDAVFASMLPGADNASTISSEQYLDAIAQTEQSQDAAFAAALWDVRNESTVSWQQYAAAIQQADLVWTERFLAKFEAPYDDMMERAFITEEYNAEEGYNQRLVGPFFAKVAPYDDMMERAFITEEYNAEEGYNQRLVAPFFAKVAPSYGGDWFDVYGNASGLLELELADPQFATPSGIDQASPEDIPVVVPDSSLGDAVPDSTVLFDYNAALEPGEIIWTEEFLATLASRGDHVIDHALAGDEDY